MSHDFLHSFQDSGVMNTDGEEQTEKSDEAPNMNKNSKKTLNNQVDI